MNDGWLNRYQTQNLIKNVQDLKCNLDSLEREVKKIKERLYNLDKR